MNTVSDQSFGDGWALLREMRLAVDEIDCGEHRIFAFSEYAYDQPPFVSA